jgi:hypothetical protein
MSFSSGIERRKSTTPIASAPAGRHRASPRLAGLSTPRTVSTSRDPWALTYAIPTGAATLSSSLRTPTWTPERQSLPAAPARGALTPEPWITKRELAAHLHVALRWIESQHHNGLPHIRRGGVLRYRISEVEQWLYGGGPVKGGA